MGLIIRSSAIHAAGCYTTSPIPKGSRVVEYTGPLIDKEEADRRYEDKPITYLFAIGEGARVIDGHGTAMFINHSCDANCETEEIEGHVWISAIRNIAAGEEVCYDYCLFDGDEQDAPCNCGATNCRGSMFSPEELKRRKKLLQKRLGRPATRSNGKRATPVEKSERTPAKNKPQQSRKAASDKTSDRQSKNEGSLRGRKKSRSVAGSKHVKKTVKTRK